MGSHLHFLVVTDAVSKNIDLQEKMVSGEVWQEKAAGGWGGLTRSPRLGTRAG